MKTVGVICCASVLALGLGLVLDLSQAADHRDGPIFGSGIPPSFDINDVYVFQSPSNSANVVMVMTVNPFAGVLNDGTFHPGASFDFQVDINGDAKEDLSFRITFSAPRTSREQDVLLRCVPESRCGVGGAPLARGETGQTLPVAGGGQLIADIFDDPFFFDLAAFQGAGGRSFCDGMQTNFFARLNVSAIVLEIPRARLGPDAIGVWARTEWNGTQVDRMGRPAINTVFIPTSFKDAFNAGLPRHDLRDFSSFLGPFSSVLLPDILTVNTSSPAGFLNGRRLEDDVIDIELSLLGVPGGSDCVPNDSVFTTVFPYLAPPN